MKFRKWFTCMIIRLAMRTCRDGFCHDHLTEALKYEKASHEQSGIGYNRQGI